MGMKPFSLKENTQIEKCPKCGNNTEFTAKSEYCAEDCCEVWVVCKCGYDPTAYKIGHKMEDVWGSLDKGNIYAALDIWNEEILEDAKNTDTQTQSS